MKIKPRVSYNSNTKEWQAVSTAVTTFGDTPMEAAKLWYDRVYGKENHAYY